MSFYSDSRYPVRDDIADVHAEQFAKFGAPGTWGTAKQRLAIVAEVARAHGGQMRILRRSEDRFGNQRFFRCRHVIETGGQVYSTAGYRVLDMLLAARPAGDNLTGGDPDVGAQIETQSIGQVADRIVYFSRCTQRDFL